MRTRNLRNSVLPVLIIAAGATASLGVACGAGDESDSQAEAVLPGCPTPDGGVVRTDGGATRDSGTHTTDGGTTSDTGTTPPGSGGSGSSTYGTPWSADSLANLEIGKSAGRQIAYRFRATHSGAFSQARFFFIFRALGYYEGNGGEVEIQLHTDDGTASHLPSGTVLSSVHITNPMAQSFPLVTFSPSVSLAEGQLYHFVFTNPAPDPVHNYVSIDDLYNQANAPNMQPGASDTDLAVVWKPSSTDAWTVNYAHTPILEVDYADGTLQGEGYIDSLASQIHTASGAAAVRETFTTSVARTITKVSVRMTRSSGASPATLRLERADGTLVDQGTVSASAVGSSAVWGSVTFATAHTLSAGQSYHIVVSAPADTTYALHPLQEGSGYGFRDVFTDGHAQYNTGAGWTDWAGRQDYDLQAYLTEQP